MQNKKGGLLFGLIAGTVLGILFAPRKGKEVRNQLKKEFKEGGIGTDTLTENFKEMGKDMAGTAHELYDQTGMKAQVRKGKKSVGKIMQKTKRTLQKTGEELYEMGKEKAEETYEQISDKLEETKENWLDKNEQPKKHRPKQDEE